VPPTKHTNKRGASDVEHRHKLERNIIYISLLTQATLTFLVVGFSAVQLNRCPVAEQDNSDSTAYDNVSCPRALFLTLITTSLGYWFPSPISSLPGTSHAEAEVTLAPRSKRKPTTKGGNEEAEVDK
jgi:hypothetical protein